MHQATRRIARFFCFTLSLAVLSNIAQAQTFTVIHTFTGGEGRLPQAPLTMDRAGDLYGTASEGGLYDFGTAFKLSRRNGGYTFSPLYSFEGIYDGDGAYPGAVVLAPDGTLYGSCGDGGQFVQYGTIFRLRPPASICASISCPWTETIVYSFQGGSDQGGPGDIVFNAAGDIVGATGDNGGSDFGTVYELTPSGSGWTYNLLYAFPSRNDGYAPDSALVIDNAGNLYGTTLYGGSGGYGTVYQLTPSGSGWVQNLLYSFDETMGAYPEGVILDSAGDLFGATSGGGSNNGGTLFELTPGAGGWTFNSFFNFTRLNQNTGPYARLTMDSQGNLYGTTYGEGAYAYGNVFKLTPSGDGWIYTDLHDFTSYSDGANPNAQIILDENGNLYGTASQGGNIYINQCLPGGCGTVWEITP